jgi:putative tryptophan/tyrosine transport system substrate-binding protein
MRRRGVIAFLGAALLWPPAAAAQQVRVVGYLTPAGKPSLRDEVFRKGLRELGWIEGKNIRLEYRRGGNDPVRMAALARELVQLKVDVIVAQSTPAVHAAKSATASIPVVSLSADPVGNGCLARPGGNITGISMMMPALAGKRIELLREISPKLSRVAFLGHGDDPSHKIFMRELQEAGSKVGVSVQPVVVRTATEFDGAFAAMKREKAEAVVVQPLFINTLAAGPRLVELALQHRIPAISDGDGFAEAGGLIFFGPHPLSIYERLASFVDRVLRGAKPDEMPIEQPQRFELVVNLRTAKSLGIAIPRTIVQRADRVIE